MYQYLVKVISSDTLLVLPNFKLHFELGSDASHYGTSDDLYQRQVTVPSTQHSRVVLDYSYTYSKSQENYSTTETEALAVLMSRGKLVTENEALTYLLN